MNLQNVTSLGTGPGGANDGYLDLYYQAGGQINLASLQSIGAQAANSEDVVRFFFQDADNYNLPANSAVNAEFYLSTGATLDLPNLTSLSGAGHSPVISLDDNATVNAPSLVTLTSTTLTLNATTTFNSAPLTSIDNSRIFLNGAFTFDRVAAAEYRNSRSAHEEVFAARGGATLDLSSLQRIFVDTNGSWDKTIVADNGTIDLSGVTALDIDPGNSGEIFIRAQAGGTINLSSVLSLNSTGGSGRVDFTVGENSQLLLGNYVAAAPNVSLRLTHAAAEVIVGGSVLQNDSGQFTAVDGATLRVEGDLFYQTTTEANFAADGARVHLNGQGIQYVEAGGVDTGLAGTGVGNFGLGQLEIGQEGTPTSVHVIDLFDNGNRSGTPGEFEALYLGGVGGDDGLVINTGSLLVLNDVNVYARLDGALVDLQAVFGDLVDDTEASAVFFLGGYLARTAPAVGDYNFDGAVDVDDYQAWKDAFGSTEDLAADGNQDGVVDTADFTVWRDAFAAAEAASTRAAVPEPVGVGLFVVAALLSLPQRGRLR
ncbi:MAG: hypothetical protein AAGJ46_05180 [Planctomycetota bacterium]